MDKSRLRGEDWGHALSLLFFVGVVAATTYPLAAYLSTRLPGRTTDTFVHYWNGWWVRQALSSGQTPFHTSYLFHPKGLSLVYHNFAWPNILGWLALEPLVGGFAAYNLILLAGLALCGWTASLLAYDLIGDRWAALVSGLIYQCWPYRMAQLDHPNLIGTFAIPLFLLFLGRAVRRPRWRSGALAGVSLALVGYTRWQLLIPVSIVGVIYLIFVLPPRWKKRREWLPPLLLAGSVALLAFVPPGALLLHEQQANPASLVKESDEVTMQTDLMAYVTPDAAHPVFGPLTAPAYDRYYSDRSAGRRFPAYVGATALVLAVLGVWRAGLKIAPWLAMAALLILLALGANLRVNGRLYPAVPMPYRLARQTFVVRLLRFPDRFSLFLALPMCVLAGYGAAQLLTALRRRTETLGAVAPYLLFALVLFEYAVVPIPHSDPDLSPFYREIADGIENGAVLNLPINPQTSKTYMFAQVTHQRPILQGKTARLPEGTYAYLEDHPLLASLRRSGEIDPTLTDVTRQLAALARDEVDYILLQKHEAEPARAARWRRYLAINPLFEDDAIAVFPTSPVAGRDFALTEELAPGIGPIEILTSTSCVDPGGVLEVDIAWGTSVPFERDISLELSLVSREGTAAARRIYPISPEWPAREWPADTIVWGYYPLDVGNQLSPGVYEVTLNVIDDHSGERGGRNLVVDRVSVPQTRCSFPVPSDATAVNGVFSDVLRLLGYQLRRDGEALAITLYWRSEQRMGADLKVFVHVFDPATKAPVAQDDAMPKRWAYPTSLWGPGEVVEDEIPISLDEAPPGEYGLAVGVYDPETMERLSVRGPENLSYDDGRLVLEEARVVVEGSEP